MKNCIIGMEGQDITINAYSKLLDYFKPQNVFCLTNKKEYENLKHKDFTDFYINSSTMNYQGKVEADSLIPLDGEMLKAFEPYFETAAMTIARKDLRNQYIVNYTPMPLDEIKLHIYRHLEYWNTIIERYNIDAFITHQVPHASIYYMIYALCKIKNVNVYLLHADFTRNNYYIVKDISKVGEQVKPIFESLKTEYANKDISDIALPQDYLEFFNKFTATNQDLTPYFMKKTSKLQLVKNFLGRMGKNGFFSYAAMVCKNLLEELKPKTGSMQSDFALRKKERKFIKQSKQYQQHWESRAEAEPDLSKKFIYMPLQMQPEMTTTPLAGIFQNQEIAAKLLASCLPDDVYIYMKEHPIQNIAFRSTSFVDTMENIKNVKLISTKYDTYKLMENSVAVASCTGTALYENSCKLKPSIMFGQWIISYMPGVYKVSTKDECQEVIDNILSNKATHTLKDLKLFVLAASKISFKGEVRGVHPQIVEQHAISVFEALKTSIENNY